MNVVDACDLAEPDCSRCVSRGIQCSGPNNLRIYVHRDADNIHTQSQRAALRAAMQRRAAHHQRYPAPQPPTAIPASSGLQLDALQRLIQETESSLMMANAPLSAKPAEFFYSTVLDAFQPRREVGVFSGDRLPLTPADGIFSSVALCIRGLLPFARPAERQVLDVALFSLLAMYMGRLINDAKMTLLACSAYTSAVREFRLLLASRFSAELASLRGDHCQFLLALSTALQLFEFVNDLGNAGPGFLTHYDGMLRLLQLSGPEVYQSPASLDSFSGLRGIAIFIALERRKDNFLSQHKWLHTPFRRRPKTRREMFHDIALQIPALLVETDHLLLSIASTSAAASPDSSQDCTDPFPHLIAAEAIIDDFAKIMSELEHWLQDLEDWYAPAPLYWETDEVLNNAYAVVDAHCVPKHDEPKHILRFRDGQKAGALIAYWAVRLEILMSLMDIETAVSMLLTHTPAAAMRAITLCQNMDANQIAADTMASLMLQSLPYLECCLEGVFVAQLPMRVAHRYFARNRLSPNHPTLLESGAVPNRQGAAAA